MASLSERSTVQPTPSRTRVDERRNSSADRCVARTTWWLVSKRTTNRSHSTSRARSGPSLANEPRYKPTAAAATTHTHLVISSSTTATRSTSLNMASRWSTVADTVEACAVACSTWPNASAQYKEVNATRAWNRTLACLREHTSASTTNACRSRSVVTCGAGSTTIGSGSQS